MVEKYMNICFFTVGGLETFRLIFLMFGIVWALPPTVVSFLSTFFDGNGLRKNAKLLRQGVLFAGLRGKEIFLVSFWTKGHDYYQEFSIYDLQWNWKIIIHDS